MTRTRNGSLSGLSVFDADIDAPTFTKAILEIVQDLNMIEDIATGAHSPGSAPVVQTMTHDGTALSGSLLGIPLINCPTPHSRRAVDGDVTTFGSSFYVAITPAFIPAGETIYRVNAYLDQGLPFTASVESYDSSGTKTLHGELSFDETDGVYFCDITLAGGDWHLIGLRLDLDDVTSNSSSLHFDGLVVAPSIVPIDVSWAPDAQDAGVPVPTAGAGAQLMIETFADAMFTDNYGIAGWLVVNVNRQINALWEWLTGAPVSGNAAVTNADSSGTDPVTTRFADHARDGLSTVPKVEYPAFAEPIGACLVDGSFVVEDASPPVTGMPSRYAPFPRTTAASIAHRVPLVMPDFDPADFRAVVVFCSDPGKGVGPTLAAGNQHDVRITGGGGSSSWTAITQIGSTNFYAAVIADPVLTADQITTYQIEVRKLAGGAEHFGDLGLLGWCLYFDP